MKLYLITGICLILISCSQNNQKSDTKVYLDSIDLNSPKKVLTSIDTNGIGMPIFYNMYLSVEMASLFQSVGAVFNPDILNKAEKTTDYITNSKKALNIGIYAVDLSYCRIFEQLELGGRYFNSMQKLAEELGIPSDYFENTSARFERNISDKDSLISIANEVYVATDNYLKDNEQYGAAAQIILGGWIEAMYIAFDVAITTKDYEIIERIAEQKNSLKNLTDMLSSYMEDEVIKNYISKLDKLRIKFSEFEVKQDSTFDPRTTEGKATINAYINKIKELQKSIAQIRSDVIE